MADDAQREIEQKSLRNVRSLLDKLEDEAAAKRRTTRWIWLGLAGAAFGVFIAVYFGTQGNKGERREIVVQPAGRTPSAPAPAAK